MSKLKDKYPNIKALFAGVGPLEEEIKSQIKDYGLENNIQLLGWRNDVKELINSCDVVGLFSKREGLGKCLLEGMICGKAVIATNTRGPRELIVNDENGFLFEIDEHEETIKSIEKIYKDKSLKSKFEYNGKKKADKYLLENVLFQLDEIYKSIESNESSLVGEIV
jgi:glycosyltransferase involved in cell wall biosynthesis